jgi:hypothetical protein
MTASAVTFGGKTKMEGIKADQADAPVDAYMPEVDCSIEAEMTQLTAANAQRILGVGTYATGAGYNQFTFGGTTAVPSTCLAVISPRRDAPTMAIYSVLFKAVQTGPFAVAFGRAKPASYKLKFQGLADLTRTAGKQIGVVVKQYAAPTGVLPTARGYTPSAIQQGPCDLWIVGSPPADGATPQLTLASDLSLDSVAHPLSLCLGMTESAVTLTLTPKLEPIKVDQADSPVDYYCVELVAKMETTLTQAALTKLQYALGLGSAAYSSDAVPPTTWEQIGFGGLTAPAQFAIAAIAPKRSNSAKAWVWLLFKVMSADGISVVASRAKPSTYKVTFAGLADITRTAGRQQGIFYETV